MFRQQLIVAIATIIGLFSIIPVAYGDLSAEIKMMKAEMKMMKSADKHGAFIDNFAQLARDKKESEILAALDQASIKGASQEQILEAFRKDVFPFFAQYQKIKPYEQITKAQVADGRVGLWHYTYIVDSDGNTKPFQIAVIDTDSGLKVLGILVGQCVKGRHPAIPPCQ